MLIGCRNLQMSPFHCSCFVAGIPTIYYFAQEAGFNCLVMELLGPSLEEVFDKCGRKFSVGTVALLAIEMVHRY